jgi:tRNA/tmRNA/rRNA uracil-C5-methylase (TrmA/RlmC/RlmD family)
MPLSPGARLTLDVLQPVAGGRMLARHSGQVVLVSGAIPGERVQVVVERASRQMVWARTVAIEQASPDRRTPGGDPACGGLTYAHIAIERQRALKGLIVADAFRRIAKHPLETPPPVRASPETGYRLRARLHVHAGHAGFFREGTHELCDAAPTGQLPSAAFDAVDAVLAWLGPHAALCQSLIVAESVAGDRRIVHVVPRPGARVADLAAPLDRPDALSGLTTIDGAGTGVATLAGDGAIEDTGGAIFGADADGRDLAGLTIVRRAPSFFQSNRFLIGALALAGADRCAGPLVGDLYAGVGLFALTLASRGARVIAVEGDPVSAGDLQTNAARCNGQVSVRVSAVEDFLRNPGTARPDAVVVDPPRTGLSRDALAGLLAWAPARVVYVSCDAPTLARDAGALIGAGYGLGSVEAFDMFPNTPHVEVLAVFDQRGR